MFARITILCVALLLMAVAAAADGPPMFVSKWGTAGASDGQFRAPRGITVDAQGDIFVTEVDNHRVQRFTHDGVFVTKWGSEGSADGQFIWPYGIAVDTDGYVYVADHGNHRVQKFTRNGAFVGKWGSFGNTDGKFQKPIGVAVGAGNNVYVTDYDGRRIQKFTSTGLFVSKWTGTEGGGAQFYRPWGIAVAPDGVVYVAEYGNNRVRKLSSNGTLITQWGSLGTGDGQFKSPAGICLDRLGNVYVADHENHRIQKFTKDGQFLTKWGTYGSGNGQFAWVSGIVVSPDNYIYTAGYVNNRVDRFLYPTSLRVTAQVRPEHDNDPFVIPSPPLVGAQVTLHAGGYEWETMTDADGTAAFPIARTPGGHYDVRLASDTYRVEVNRWTSPDSDPVTKSVGMNQAGDATEFEWSNGMPLLGIQLDEAPSIQGVYYAERFRTDYWASRLNYVWTLPAKRGWGANIMGIRINELLADFSLQFELGGASVFEDAARQRYGMRFSGQKSREADVVYHEYTHLVIADRLFTIGQATLGQGIPCDEGAAMDEALADYFAASYTNDPGIGPCSFFAGCSSVRSLTDSLIYPTNYCYEAHKGSLILSGALWDLRTLIDGEGVADARTTDLLVFRAVDQMISAKAQDPIFHFVDFYDALRATDATQGGQFSSQIDAAFEAHNITHSPIPYSPLTWENNDGITAVNEISATQVEFTWLPIAGALSYQVLAASADYDQDSGAPLASFVTVADSIIGTSYVFSQRDPRTRYLFTVAAVDNRGQPGYMAMPADVEPLDATGVRDVKPIAGGTRGRFLFNCPNPFNPVTRISFELARADRVHIVIFDVGGRKIKDLVTAWFEIGKHQIEWEGTDQYGGRVASGHYFVVLNGTEWKDSGKILLLK